MTFRVLWDHFTPFHCLASTEAGTLHYIDVRKVGVNTQHFIRVTSRMIAVIPGNHSTLDAVSSHRGGHRHLHVSPLPWRCFHCVSRQNAQGLLQLKLFLHIRPSSSSENLDFLLQHFLRSGTSRGPSQPLLVSAPLVLAPFTPLTTVLMCPSSLQLEETKPVTISRYDCFFQNCRVCSDHT